MNTTNLNIACEAYAALNTALRAAHTDAVNSEKPFAEIALFALLEPVSKLGAQLLRVKEAAAKTQRTAGGRKPKAGRLRANVL